jgi:putative zinc finger/helix-turn-helix YgiT family protein
MDITNKDTDTPTPVKRCYECSGAMRGTRQNYRYTECGLSSVVLKDILVYNCPACGAIVPEITAIDALHNSIAMFLLKKEGVLIGEEIKYLRKMANYSAAHLAKIMGVTVSALSRWENDKLPIGDESDRLLRFACLAGIVQLGVPAMGPQAEKMFDIAKEVKSLNLSDVLAGFGERPKDGPRKISINPEDLAQFGGTTPDATPVVQ